MKGVSSYLSGRVINDVWYYTGKASRFMSYNVGAYIHKNVISHRVFRQVSFNITQVFKNEEWEKSH